MLNLNTNWPTELIKTIKQWYPVVKSNFATIQSAFNGHVSGTTDKHNASSIINDSAETGGSVKEVMENTRTELNSHYTGTLNKHTASTIVNDSTEEGNNIKEVIENNRIELNFHYAGDTNRHTASSITNDSLEEGGTVEAALNNNKARFDNHVAGTLNKHNAEHINYSGSFIGKDNVKAALDQAKSEIDTIVTNASKDPEVALARNSAVKAKTFATLDDRLEESEQEFIDLVNNMSDYETTSGSQTKADTALSSAKTYTDEKTGQIQTELQNTNYNVSLINNIVNTHLSDYTNHVPHLGIASNVDNSYSITSSKNISDGSKFSVKFNVAATGTATLNISSDGTPRGLIKPGGVDFKPKAGTYLFIRDGENFQCLGEGGDYGNVTAPKVFKGVIFGTENGLDVGTLDIPDEAWFQPNAKWYECTQMESSTYTNDIGTCVCDNKLYNIARLGGGSEDTRVDKTIMYNPMTNIWVEETKPPVPIIYYSYVCGVFNHKIYWHTGNQPTSFTDNIYIYDTIAKTWSSIIVKTTTNHGGRAKWVMTDENTFYCIGGDGVYRVDLYNRVTDTVTQKADAPGYMANAGVLYHKETNTIYVCGNSYSPSNTPLCAYNCIENTWSVKSALFSSNPVYHFSMITKNETQILVGGGYKDSGTSFNTIYLYDIPTNTFSTYLTAPSNKMSGSIALINNKLYWYGGYTTGGVKNTCAYFY